MYGHSVWQNIGLDKAHPNKYGIVVVKPSSIFHQV